MESTQRIDLPFILGKSNPTPFEPLRVFAAMLNGHADEIPPLLHSAYGNLNGHLGLDYYSEKTHLNNNNSIKKEAPKNGYISNKSAKCQDLEKSMQKNYPRLVAKDGHCLIQPLNLDNQYKYILKNWFHLIIENSWRSILIVFATSFLFSWLFFGAIYYFIVYISGDLQNLPHHKQCIANVHSFISAFLFSLESQHTIGYGVRYMTDVCPSAYIVLCMQCIIGVLLQTMLAGIVIAKVLRPKKRKMEMRFSQKAVIGPCSDEDKRPSLMIRLADIQHRLYLAESHVRLYMACTRINQNGDKELLGVKDMNVGYDSGWDRVLLLWPVIIRHVIDEESPLYGMTQERMRNADFELIMTVEGIVEATGMTFQARTSFLPHEIFWGQKFAPMVVLNNKTNKYEVDYKMFEKTESCIELVPLILTEMIDENEDDTQHHKSHHEHHHLHTNREHSSRIAY